MSKKWIKKQHSVEGGEMCHYMYEINFFFRF